MNHIPAPVIFGLPASLFWGSGDFSGGLASRRANTSSVVLVAYAVGFVLLVALALIWQEPFPGPSDLLWGGLAGVAGGLELLSFFSAPPPRQNGVAAPLSAALSAKLPPLLHAFTAGRPPPLVRVGSLLPR